MKRLVFIVLLLGIGFSRLVSAQALLPSARISAIDSDAVMVTFEPTDEPSWPALRVGAELPMMSADLALTSYERHAASQSTQLASYSAVSVIHAELPDSAQQGEFEVERTYSAPHTLLFKPIWFAGDKFVKSNIIARVLQSEVDHVEKDDFSATAMSPENYKFSYKGKGEAQGRLAYVYQVKPRAKRIGLIKGRMYVDAHTGSLLRVEGNVVKSPSFFVSHIQFVQDYGDFGSFTLPVHVHTEAKARLVGRTIVDITHTHYAPVPVQSQAVVPTM